MKASINIGKNSVYNRFRCLLVIIFTSTLTYQSFASITISPATYIFCGTTWPSTYQTQSWSITETNITNNSGFTKGQTNATLTLTLASGFTFKNTGYIATVTASGTEITINSFTFLSTTQIRVTITTSVNNVEYNTIFFNNFEVCATASGSSGKITRTAGTFKIDNSTSTPASTVAWANLTSSTNWNGDNSGPDKSICYGSSTTIGGTTSGGHTYSWSPVTGLSDANISNPNANPTITTTYSLTESITGTGCTSTNDVILTVNALPVVTITTHYCGGGGKIELSSNTFTSYQWNTYETTQSILVDVAGNYKVTATDANGCKGVDSTQVALEYITNGNFSSGNSGFTSAYVNNQEYYTVVPTGLWNEGLYAIGTNANSYHPNFFGTDRTNPGTGNFMIVNGNTTTTPITVWSENITISPNTIYYFSAYAMSMNQVGNYAQLWFAVNGVQVGATVTLPAGANSTSGPFTWTRFYGTWYSGATTEANLSIVDLQTAPDGNDFGLDDISCSTFSGIELSVAPTGGPVCLGSNLSLAAHRSGGFSPFTYSWSGPNSFSSESENPNPGNATELMAGNYFLTITDAHGCTANGSVSVTVNTNPDIYDMTGGGSYCSGGSGFDVGLSSSQNGVNYQLKLNGSNSGSPVAGTGSAISFGTKTAEGTYTAVATNAATGCTSNMNNNAIISIITPSTAPTGISGNSPICVGNSTTLTATGGTAGPVCTYEWGTGTSIGSNIISGQTLVSVIVSPSVTTTYWVRRIDTLPCPLTTDGVTLSITVIPELTAEISGGASPLCFNTSPGTFTTTASGGSGTYTYQWYANSVIINGATNSSYTSGPIITNTDFYCEVTSSPCWIVSTSITVINLIGNLIPGLWTGCISELWEVGENWADGNVPFNSINVLIPATAAHQPVIYDSISGICNNIVIGSGASLTLMEGGLLNILGTLNINGEPPGTLTNDGVVTIAGDLNNEGSPALGTGEIIFNGSTSQLINGTNDFGKLTFSKSGGDITNQGVISVSSRIKFLNGILNTTASNILTMKAGSYTFNATPLISGALNESYVNGPMIKTGNTNFIFPVGKSNSSKPLHPIGIELTDTSSVTFFAEYFCASTINKNLIETPIKMVAPNEYWMLNRTSGTNNAYVTVGWRNIIMYNIDDAVCVHFEENIKNKWENKGNTSVTGVSGKNSYGTVRSQLCTEFSPFTYGLTHVPKGDWNPLPIDLISWTATPDKNKIKLEWATASETNNDYFSLEKSRDGVGFQLIGTVKGNGNSNKILYYNFDDDSPFKGVNYYRLKQTNFDGKSEYFKIINADFITSNKAQLILSVISSTLSKSSTYLFDISLIIDHSGQIIIQIFDLSGHHISYLNFTPIEGSNIYSIILPYVSSGSYIISISSVSSRIIRKISF